MSSSIHSGTPTFKFVFAHQLVGGTNDQYGIGRGGIEWAGKYEWGGYNLDGSWGFDAHRPGWGKTIHQLLVDNHVNIFFQGHDYLFARQELDGVVYQTLPTPADPNYAIDNAAAYRSGDKLPASDHVRVTVSPDGVTVDYIRAFLPQDEVNGQINGAVAYSYRVGLTASSLRPAPAQPGSLSAQNPALTGPAHPVDMILGR